MFSLFIAGIGAIVAAVGGGVLLARCFRAPRGDLIAWSVALLGLLISLGSQAIGHLTGFDAAMFRAMELGGQVIAPLAVIAGLTEVSGRTAAVRFCARLYLPAIALVAIVILSLDQLSQAAFTKSWPDPAVFYQLPPAYVLMFVIGPVTALVAVIAMVTVQLRAQHPAWRAARPAVLLGGGAALALAYPCLAQLVASRLHVHLPVTTAFPLLLAVAAGLTWLAGLRTQQLNLQALHRAAPAGQGGAARRDQDDALTAREPARQRGQYREGGAWRPAAGPAHDSPGEPGHGWRDDSADHGPGDDWSSPGATQYPAGYHAPDYATGDFAPADYGTGEYANGSYAPADDGPGEFATGDFAAPDFAAPDFGAPDYAAGEMAPQAGGWQAGPAGAGRSPSGAVSFPAGGVPGRDDPARAQLFGQIAIYTLLEERVAEFDQLIERVVAEVRSREPDTLVFIVHGVPSAPMQRILYEVYRDRAAYDRHAQQPYVQQFAVDRRPYVLATNVIELGLQQAKVSPFPSVSDSVSDLFGEPGYDTSGFERPDYLRDFGTTPAQPGQGSREFR